MNKQFENKRICFLGASTIQNGGFIACLRSYYSQEGYKRLPYFFNRGLGGNRAIMVKALLCDEVLSLQPDYCFILFGLNDMGIWLYDSNEKETAELLQERKERDELFYKGIFETVKELKTHGIVPILISTLAVNERLMEREDIETVADNKEKGRMIGDGFYKRKTFANINQKLRTYSERLKQYAKSENIDFIDGFDYFYSLLDNASELYREDGIHLTEYGQGMIARMILEFFDCENIPEKFQMSAYAKRLLEIEKTERNIQYVKWAIFHPDLGYKTDEMEQNARRKLQQNNLSKKARESIEDYLQYGGRVDELRACIWKHMQVNLLLD